MVPWVFPERERGREKGREGEKSLYSMQNKHSQQEESTSQSDPGFKSEGSPSPITKMIHTHTHMKSTHIMLKGMWESASTTHASLSHTQLSSEPSLCLFTATPYIDTISFYLNYISQLPLQELLLFFLCACTPPPPPHQP